MIAATILWLSICGIVLSASYLSVAFNEAEAVGGLVGLFASIGGVVFSLASMIGV